MTDHRDGNPESAFGALGSELRLDILQILESAARESASRLTFSDLYERLDIESTSQLSYHLGRLDGVFVQKSGDKYGLTQAGERVVRAVYAGTYTEHPSFETVSIDGRCPHCGHTALLAAFEEPFLSVTCGECGETVAKYDLPPAQAVGRSPKEVLRSCDRRVYHELGMAIDGTCPTCGGIMDASGRQRTPPRTDEYVVTASCRRCFNQVYAPVELCVFYHPALVAAYWSDGRDATSVRPWNVYSYTIDWEVTFTSVDPFEARVETDVLDDQFVVTILGGAVSVDIE
ncbi:MULTISPECIES: winged helix-turn-helix domain-containing protein [Haloferax]|uniref:Helix-turn-helix domain-containing protein n=1 Tax=Haloferax marinum TaxID=2666143 RepID=A0A6A8GC04_9EURY|nr:MULTISPECIES: winged helix-turn-helix domain-containing protein [Haloferax]KAB1191198.1 helix-turn-helix domain-containing protein [Haloferax sp. CBA1150]MRW98088.1 helix-turn-helix domain-containing protein [Haloferax marinum]